MTWRLISVNFTRENCVKRKRFLCPRCDGIEGGVKVWLHSILISVLDGSVNCTSQPLPQGKNPVPVEHATGWAPEPVWTIFIVALCVLVYVEFTHQQMHFYLFKEHIKVYILIHTNIAPTCFGLRPSSGSLH